jgi:DNA polymerase-3 subunit epsilon
MAASWRQATNLVALDLEGSGAQDGEREDILEIAAVRLIDGRPDVATAYATLIDPGRPIPARPWISAGLSGTALAGAAKQEAVEQALAPRLDGAYLVGHNISVDWRLLHRRCPRITIAGLIDTYRLAKTLPGGGKHGLTDLLARYQLTEAVSEAAPNSQPHRALWDTIGAALLLEALVQERWTADPSLPGLLAVAGPPTSRKTTDAPATLFD